MKKLSMRTAERLIRQAYAMEELASRLRYDGHAHWADSVNEIAKLSGKVGRSLASEIEGKD